MGPLFFFVYTGDLVEGMRFNAKLFADETSLFSIITVIPSPNLDEELFKIRQWAYQWNMSFNLDISRQARKFCSQKKKFKSSNFML